MLYTGRLGHELEVWEHGLALDVRTVINGAWRIMRFSKARCFDETNIYHYLPSVFWISVLVLSELTAGSGPCGPLSGIAPYEWQVLIR
jgi:hypothetical protein